MIIVKYNGTQKIIMTQIFCIYYIIRIDIPVCSSVPEHHVEQILDLFHKCFPYVHVYMSFKFML